jgi:hypothetical protein
MPVLLGCKAFSRRSSGGGQTVLACHQNSPPMPVLKKMLSTDMLPQGLSERQRFMFFAELFEHFPTPASSIRPRTCRFAPR